MSHFFKNMGIVGGSLAFFVAGAGAYSLDRRKARSAWPELSRPRDFGTIFSGNG
jgi:hypothetical protein